MNWDIVGDESFETRHQNSRFIDFDMTQSAVGTQPKISKFPTLVSEFKEICSVVSNQCPSTNEKRQLTETFHGIPGLTVVWVCWMMH